MPHLVLCRPASTSRPLSARRWCMPSASSSSSACARLWRWSGTSATTRRPKSARNAASCSSTGRLVFAKPKPKKHPKYHRELAGHRPAVAGPTGQGGRGGAAAQHRAAGAGVRRRRRQRLRRPVARRAGPGGAGLRARAGQQSQLDINDLECDVTRACRARRSWRSWSSATTRTRAPCSSGAPTGTPSSRSRTPSTPSRTRWTTVRMISLYPLLC